MSQQPDQTPRGLPPLLCVSEVMGRYGLRDRRPARRLMDVAGGFRVGRRLLVSSEDLLAHEERLITARPPATPPHPHASKPPRRTRTSPAPPTPLPPGWWREDT